MKSTAKQEHNLNFKRNSYIPKMCVDPCPVGSTTTSLTQLITQYCLWLRKCWYWFWDCRQSDKNLQQDKGKGCWEGWQSLIIIMLVLQFMKTALLA